MAVKTNFYKEDFEVILAQYSFGDYVDFKPFETGADQTNLLLVTAKGKFVLRYYEKRSRDYVLFEIELLHFLADHSYPCAAPMKNNTGKYFGIYKDKPFALFEFLEGEHSEDNERNYLLVTEQIAELHKLTINYKPVNFQLRASYSVDYCWESANDSAGRITDKEEAQNRLSWMRNHLDNIKLPESLPNGVCHGDINPTNFLYKDEQLPGVLDFDQASFTWLLHDIAQLIYWWTWPNKGEIDFEKTAQLVRKYDSIRKLTDSEINYLFDVLKLVNLIGMAWDMGSEDFDNNKRKVEYLTTMGKQAFKLKVFNY